MKIYNITKGQLIVIWTTGIILFANLYNQTTDGYWDFDFGYWEFNYLTKGFVLLGVLIFYTIGWRNWRKKNN